MGTAKVLERFDDSARRALVRAGLEAQMLNHSTIATEHVLLALAHDPSSVAGHALVLHGLDRCRAQQAVLRLVDPGQDATRGPVGFSPRVRDVLQIALMGRLWDAVPLSTPSANRCRADAIVVTDYALLLSLFLYGEGIAAHVLEDNGVTVDSLSAAIRRARGDDPEAESRREGTRVQLPSREYLLGEAAYPAAAGGPEL